MELTPLEADPISVCAFPHSCEKPTKLLGIPSPGFEGSINIEAKMVVPVTVTFTLWVVVPAALVAERV